MLTTAEILHRICSTTSDVVVCVDRVQADSPWHLARRPDGRLVHVVGIWTSIYRIREVTS